MASIPIFDRMKLNRQARLVGQFLAGSWVIALLTFCGYALHLKLPTIGFLYLLTVITIALTCGFWQATFTSLLAVTCLSFFFVQPIFTFYVTDPQNWIALATFEITALIVSRLSAREQRHAEEAILQRTAMEKLYELSRNILLLNLHQAPGPQIAQLVQSIFSVEAVALFDASLNRVDYAGLCMPDDHDLAMQTYLQDVRHADAASRTSHHPLHVSAASIGAIVIRGGLNPLTADAIASLAAIALERFHSFEQESRVKAAYQSEELRTAVLDALAHAFKTPLTAIRTASSGLLEMGGLNEAQTDLATLIDEQSIHLNELATRLLQTARLDAEEIHVKKENVVIAQLIEEVIEGQAANLSGHAVQVTHANPTLTARGDRELLTTIVAQFVDNAGKYSIPGSPILICAEGSRRELLISVHNRGPVILTQDRERIFDRFYRCPESRHRAPGTGIGLSIAKKAADAHHGHVWVTSNKDEGTTFYLSIPHAGRSH